MIDLGTPQRRSEASGRRMSVRLAWLVAVIAMAVTACGGGSALQLSVPEGELAYEPAQLEAPAGSEVTIEFTNQDRRQHDLVVVRGVFESEQAAKEAMEADPEVIVASSDRLRAEESATMTVTFDEPGEYQFFCSIPGHFGAGMQGTITVGA